MLLNGVSYIPARSWKVSLSLLHDSPTILVSLVRFVTMGIIFQKPKLKIILFSTIYRIWNEIIIFSTVLWRVQFSFHCNILLQKKVIEIISIIELFSISWIQNLKLLQNKPGKKIFGKYSSMCTLKFRWSSGLNSTKFGGKKWTKPYILEEISGKNKNIYIKHYSYVSITAIFQILMWKIMFH